MPATVDQDPEAVCPNCGATGAGAFCSRCGQRWSERITFKGAWRESLTRLTELDFRLLRTFLALSTRPGAMVREFIDGRRIGYTHPLKYAFIVITIFVLAVHLFQIDLRLAGAPLESERELAALQLIGDLSAYLFFPTAAIVGVLLWRIHYRSGDNYAEALVFTLYVLAHVHFWSLIVGATLGYRSPAGASVLLGGQLAYLTWAVTGCFRMGVWRACGEAAAIVAVWLAAFNAVAWGFANVAAWMGLL